MKKSLFGLGENIVSALSYAIVCFSGIAVLIMEKENKLVRFHALQSTIWFLFLSVLGWVVNIFAGLPLIGLLLGVVSWAIGVVWLVSWVGLMFMAFKGQTFKLPVIGDVVWAQINK